MNLWHPERLETVGSVLQRYATHLRPGHVVRLGMDGDPCGFYRGDDPARVGVVQEITREGEKVTFRAAFGDEIRTLTNTSVLPEDLWEIDPSGEETFRADVAQDLAADSEPAAVLPADVSSPDLSSPADLSTTDLKDQLYGALRKDCDALEEKLYGALRKDHEAMEEKLYGALRKDYEALEEEQTKMRSVFAETVRHLASDLLRTSQGHPAEFSRAYADRYDDAAAAPSPEPYRGDGKRKWRGRDERHTFTLSDQLTYPADRVEERGE